MNSLIHLAAWLVVAGRREKPQDICKTFSERKERRREGGGKRRERKNRGGGENGPIASLQYRVG